MSVFTIRRRRFNWAEFSRAVTHFAAACGLEEAYSVVDDGRVVSWQDHDELGGVPAHPLRRLQARFTVFAAFTAFRTAGLLACADGGVIAVADLGDVGEVGSAAPLSDEQRRLVGRTEYGECRCYGFLISMDGGKLTLQTALMSDSDGECTVEPVAEAGLADEPMAQFIRRFIRRKSKL